MITRTNLSFEPPEPPPHRVWPEYVRLTYGSPSGVELDDTVESDRQTGRQYLGWMIRMGYHLIGRIGEQTTRTSDEAVLSVALLLDLQNERDSADDEPGGLAMLDELQGRLLAQLRRHSLPTGIVDYENDEGLAVLRDWANCMDGVRGYSAVILGEFLPELEDLMRARGQVTVRGWASAITASERAEVAEALRAMAVQVETGALHVTELRTVEQPSSMELRLRGWVRPSPVPDS